MGRTDRMANQKVMTVILQSTVNARCADMGGRAGGGVTEGMRLRREFFPRKRDIEGNTAFLNIPLAVPQSGACVCPKGYAFGSFGRKSSKIGMS